MKEFSNHYDGFDFVPETDESSIIKRNEEIKNNSTLRHKIEDLQLAKEMGINVEDLD